MVHDVEPNNTAQETSVHSIPTVGHLYCEDTGAGKQTSLRTRDRADAQRLLAAKNEATHQPAMNLQIAQVDLQHGDPALATRTGQNVMTPIAAVVKGIVGDANYGDDSDLLCACGYVRKSERASGLTRKSTAAKPAATAGK